MGAQNAIERLLFYMHSVCVCVCVFVAVNVQLFTKYNYKHIAAQLANMLFINMLISNAFKRIAIITAAATSDLPTLAGKL